jgi:hypothetical protein
VNITPEERGTINLNAWVWSPDLNQSTKAKISTGPKKTLHDLPNETPILVRGPYEIRRVFHLTDAVRRITDTGYQTGPKFDSGRSHPR